MAAPRLSLDFTIRTKALIAFLAISATAAVVGAFGLYTTGALARGVIRLANERLPSVEGLNRLQNAITAMRLDTAQAIEDAVQGRNAGFADLFRARETDRARAMQGMAKYAELDLTPEEAAIWEKIDPTFNAFVVANKDIWDAIRTHEVQAAVMLQAQLGARMATELTAPLEQLVALQGKIGERISAEAEQSATRSRRALWTVIAASLIAATALALLLTASITRPLRRLASQAALLRDAVAAGRLEIRGDPDQVGREFRPIIAGMNETMEAFARPVTVTAEYVSAIALGDSPPPITDTYLGDFDVIKSSLNELVEITTRRNRDIEDLVTAALEGRLDQRGDPSGYQGANARVIEGVNRMLDALVQPLRVAEDHVDRIARGDIPEPITADYRGDFDRLKQSLNTCIGSLGGVLRDMGQMTAAQAAGETDAFIDEERFQGAYRSLAAGVNAGVRVHVEVLGKVLDLLSAYADGDFSPVLERLPGKQAAASARMDQLRTNLRAVADQIRGVAGAAVEGRLSARADASAFRGDWAALVNGLNATLDALAAPVDEAARVLERLAARDLRARATGDYRGDHARLRDALNASGAALHDALGQVSSAVDQVSGAATQIASSSQAVASGAAQQASSLSETTSAMEAVAGLTRKATEGARQANGLAQAARAAATEGASAVGALQGTMTRIQEAAAGTSQIIRDVSDIAFQTNLLALNAAVEAARAGEAGRGFAVVAEEVRSLALRAKEAAHKTEDLIRQSVTQAAEGEAAARQASGRLAEIVEGVAKVTAVVGEIAGVAEQQAAGIERVKESVGEADRVTQQNAASAEQSSAAASELNAQSEELAAMVATFQLEARAGGGLARVRGGSSAAEVRAAG
jgi:methyl-accepting chemotaxis protein